MAYNRKLFLKRVLEAQETAKVYILKGVSQKYVYENYIKERYNISYSTFSNWMGIPAAAELKKMAEEENN